MKAAADTAVKVATAGTLSWPEGRCRPAVRGFIAS